MCRGRNRTRVLRSLCVFPSVCRCSKCRCSNKCSVCGGAPSVGGPSVGAPSVGFTQHCTWRNLEQGRERVVQPHESVALHYQSVASSKGAIASARPRWREQSVGASFLSMTFWQHQGVTWARFARGRTLIICGRVSNSAAHRMDLSWSWSEKSTPSQPLPWSRLQDLMKSPCCPTPC